MAAALDTPFGDLITDSATRLVRLAEGHRFSEALWEIDLLKDLPFDSADTAKWHEENFYAGIFPAYIRRVNDSVRSRRIVRQVALAQGRVDMLRKGPGSSSGQEGAGKRSEMHGRQVAQKTVSAAQPQQASAREPQQNVDPGYLVRKRFDRVEQARDGHDPRVAEDRKRFGQMRLPRMVKVAEDQNGRVQVEAAPPALRQGTGRCSR